MESDAELKKIRVERKFNLECTDFPGELFASLFITFALMFIYRRNKSIVSKQIALCRVGIKFSFLFLIYSVYKYMASNRSGTLPHSYRVTSFLMPPSDFFLR